MAHFFFYAFIVVFLLTLIHLLWWYFPELRNPWAPLLRMRRRFLKRYGTQPLIDPRIVVEKSRRRLSVYDGQRLVRNWPVVFGLDVEHRKQRENDGCTPEGKYYICTKNDKSIYHLFLGISYPGITDAERGLRQGLISQKEYEAIARAERQRERPPWNTKLGGAIGIHGGGIDTDWTEGGIAMTDADIEELFLLVDKGWPIEIGE